jgi:DMSO/TMAO reductase YedYZ molybdopterin-dependent catalytic subunit
MNRSGDPAEYVLVDGSEPQSKPNRYGRGVFLTTVAAGLTSLAWGKPVWDRVSGAIGPAESLVPLVPKSGWRIYTVSGSMPTFDRASWRLQVGGLVQHEYSLDYAQLRALPRAHQVSDFHCVTGWTVPHVRWAGVRISDLLDRAKPLPGGHALQFVSAESPYVDYLTLDQALLKDVMVAYEMDGKPLPREHGAPLRLIIPEMYGYKNVKWLARVNVVSQADAGYWEYLGYDRDAWVGRSNGYHS